LEIFLVSCNLGKWLENFNETKKLDQRVGFVPLNIHHGFVGARKASEIA
jgi:hypothetical protein